MPGLNGAEATRAVLSACPTTRVVCLSASVTQQEIDEVRAAGAVACVTKDEDFDRLVATVREAARHEADRREHRGRPRLDRRLPGRAGALPELPRRAALRALRRRELPRLRRHHARTSFYERLAHGAGAADHLAADAGRLPRDVYEELAPCVRADPLAADLLDPLRHVRERPAGGGAARRRPGARDRLADGLGVARDARDRRAAPARARHDRRGDRRARRALPPTGTSCSSRSTRSSTSRRAAASAAQRRSPAAS